jgi:hypothetical protein
VAGQFRFDYLARCSSSAAESALYEVLLLGEALRALDRVAAMDDVFDPHHSRQTPVPK